SSAGTIPLLAVLFLPIVVGLPELYSWIPINSAPTTAAFTFRQVYLDAPFFVLRAIIYFAAWIIVASRVTSPSRLSAPVDGNGDRWPSRRRSAVALLLVGLTASFANVDWIMSLEPTWTSTIFPALVTASDLLVGFAVVVGVVSRLGDRSPFDG